MTAQRARRYAHTLARTVTALTAALVLCATRTGYATHINADYPTHQGD